MTLLNLPIKNVASELRYHCTFLDVFQKGAKFLILLFLYFVRQLFGGIPLYTKSHECININQLNMLDLFFDAYNFIK